MSVFHNRLERFRAYSIIKDVCKKAKLQEKVRTHTFKKTFKYHHYKQYKDIANIKRQDYLKQLFSIIAAYSSKFIDKSKITSAMPIANRTLDSHLGILENTYLLDKLPPFLKS